MSTEQRLPESACDTCAVSLAALTLGEPLAPDEQTRLLAHLALCQRCRRRLDEYATVAQLLPLAVPEVAPSPELRARILAAAGQTRTATRPLAPRGTPWAGWRRLVQPALGLALAALLALGLNRELAVRGLQAQISAQQAQTQTNIGIVTAAFGNDDAIEATLGPSAAAPAASGRVFISPGEPAVAVYARDLPQLPEGQIYQVWLVTPAGTISAGTFVVNPAGRGWRPLRPSEPLVSVERVFVTMEPTGGSPQPTGPEQLSGVPVRDSGR
jgi:anti-sigma-K factor RskA